MPKTVSGIIRPGRKEMKSGLGVRSPISNQAIAIPFILVCASACVLALYRPAGAAVAYSAAALGNLTNASYAYAVSTSGKTAGVSIAISPQKQLATYHNGS